jgi:outer membrane lipoprotein-sorting protein
MTEAILPESNIHLRPLKPGLEASHPTMKTMRNPRRQVPAALALILSFVSSSCLISRRSILRNGKPATASQPLRSSTRDGLNSRIANLYNAINSFQATVEMTPSVGSVYKGEITEIKDVHAYVLFAKPARIRIIGQLPVVRTKAFDMVSNGTDFKVHLVSKNLFVEGSNQAPAVSSNKLENLRPDALLSSMLIRPDDTASETAVLEDATDEDSALYILHFIRKRADGQIFMGRNVWFDRLDLSIVRQKVFDDTGATVSDTRYSKWMPYNGVMFPAHIDINRPVDGYGVVMDVLEMKMNLPMTDDKFVLNQPEGTKLQAIGGGTK